MASPGRSAVVEALAALVVIGIAAVALFALPASDSPLTYGAASGRARVLGVGAGAALVVAVLLTARVTITLLLVALAAVWFGQDLAALGDSAALPRSIADAAAPVAAVLALHLALALPEGR